MNMLDSKTSNFAVNDPTGNSIRILDRIIAARNSETTRNISYRIKIAKGKNVLTKTEGKHKFLSKEEKDFWPVYGYLECGVVAGDWSYDASFDTRLTKSLAIAYGNDASKVWDALRHPGEKGLSISISKFRFSGTDGGVVLLGTDNYPDCALVDSFSFNSDHLTFLTYKAFKSERVQVGEDGKKDGKFVNTGNGSTINKK